MPTDRIHSFDALRVLACAGIVLFHLAPASYSWANAGLPVFVILTGFGIAQTSRRELAGYARDRALRLLVPWVFWYAVYAIERTVITGSALPGLSPLDLLHGPAIHLWYLPFAFIASVAMTLVLRDRRRMIAAFIAFAMGLAVLGVGPHALPEPLAQWWYSVPALVFGLMLGSSRGPSRDLSGLIAVAVAAAVLVAAQWMQGAANFAVQYALGTASVLLAMRLRLPPSRSVRAAADLTLGVYLAHPALFDVCHKLGFGAEAPRYAISLLASFAITALMRRLPAARMVV